MLEPVVAEPAALPLWRPRTARAGLASIGTMLDSQALAKAVAGGVNTDAALITAWTVLASRYLDTPQVTVGICDGADANAVKDDKPWAMVVPVEPDSIVAQVYRHVNLQLSHEQTTTTNSGATIGSSFNSLVVLGQSAVLQDNGPWHSAMQRQHCSVLIRLTANQNSRSIHLSYDKAMYADEAIQELGMQLSAVFTALLNALSASNNHAEVRVRDLAWVSGQQKTRLLDLATVSANSKDNIADTLSVSITERFNQWVATTPDQIALVHGQKAMTYSELHLRVTALAYELRSKYGMSCESRVAVFGQRSAEVTIAIMAVVYASGTFVPIDSQLPMDRVAYILDDSQCTVVLTTSHDAIRLPTQCTLPAVHVDGLANVLSRPDLSTTSIEDHSNSLAYIIYTSGTTGRPKGVMVERGSLVNIATDPFFAQYYRPGTKSLQFFSVAFDLHIFVLFATLCHGATLRLMGESPLDDLAQVDVAGFTPSFLSRIDATQFTHLKMVFVIGEACPPALAKRWASQCMFINAYGPTETAIISHIAVLAPNDTVTIGKPLSGYSCYVVDHSLHLVPMGVVGELLIGGVGVARGYCNLSELTAERFLPNPFGPGRVYRTGDLVRWLPDGHLEYLGRRDNQVKLNGFRIELEEVESVAGQCSQVQQAAAIIHHNHLLCFVTPELSDFAPLVDHLRQTLPHYMVPHTLVALAQFPTTVNGKVDRRALADLDLTSTLHLSLVADSAAFDLGTDTALDTASDHACIEQEAVLRQAWAELLDVPLDRIARQAHFFQLGGDSIVAILLVSKCRQQGYQLTVPTVYAHPVLASLARHLMPLHDDSMPPPLLPLSPTEQWFAAEPPLNPNELDQLKSQLTQRRIPWSQVEDLYPCTLLQTGLLLSTMRNPHAYLLQYHVTLTGELDLHRLEASWQQVVLRHSILRTVFLEAPSQVTTGFVQVVLDRSIVHFDADLTKAAEELSAKAYQRLHTNFALDSPLFQVSVGALPNTTSAHQMTITFHHAMLDGWSFPVIVGEMLKCYHDTPSSALISSSFKPFTKRILDNRSSESIVQFWQKYLSDAPQSPAPLLSATADMRAAGYSDYRNQLPMAKSTLLAFARRHGFSLSTLLRGAYALVLSRYLGTDQVVFGVIVAGRNVDVDNITTLIGPCFSAVPFRVSTSDQPVLKWLQKLHENYVRMIPYEQANVADIARWCQVSNHTSLFGTLMGFENQPPLAQDPTHGLQATSITFTEFADYPFGVAFEELPDAIVYKVGYANALYDSDVGPRVAQHLAYVVEQLITADHTLHLGSITFDQIGDEALLVDEVDTSGEHSMVLVDVLNAATLVATNAPCRIALQMPDHTWTYSQLLVKAHKLAQRMDAVIGNDQQHLVVAVIDDVSDLAVTVLASMITQLHLVLVASQSTNLDIPTLVHHVEPSLVLAPTAVLSQHLAVPVLAIHAGTGDSTSPSLKPRSYVHCFKLSIIDDMATSGAILKAINCLSTAYRDDGHAMITGPGVLTDGSLELSLWVLLQALQQGMSIQALSSTTNGNHPANAIEYQVLRPFTNFAMPNHAVVYLVDLADLLTFSPDPSLCDDTIVCVFHDSLFSTHTSTTVREWRHSRWPKLCMPQNTWQVVDKHGAICPIGIIGHTEPVTRSVAFHAITSGKPSPLDGCHTPYPVLGLYSSQGTLQLVGSLAHRMTINGVQWHPSSVLPVLSQLGWQIPAIQVLSSSEWVIMVSNRSFDVADDIKQLVIHLPAHCPPPTVVSYTFFPNLSRIASDAPKLRAFLAAYALAKSTAHGPIDDIALWLTTIWHYLAHGHDQSGSDISNNSFWNLGGMLADLVQLRHLISERFGIALTMAELWDNTRFPSMVQLIHEKLNTPDQLEHLPVAMKHAAVLYRTPLPISRLSTWCQAQLCATMDSRYYQQTVQWPSTLTQTTVQSALDHVIATHAHCRLSFVEEHGTVYQRVHAEASVAVRAISLDNGSPVDSHTIDELVNQHHGRFDFQVPGLISVVHMTSSLVPSEHCHTFLSVRIHPLIGAQSLVTQLMRQLRMTCQSQYAAAPNHGSAALPTFVRLPVLLNSCDQVQPGYVDYWMNVFKDIPHHLDLPDDRTTLDDPTWHFNTMSVDVASHTHSALTAYAKANSSDLTNILGALVSLYMARVSNQNEFLLGLVESLDYDTLPSVQPACKQPRTLPLRIAYNQQSSLADLVNLFRANRLGARDHYSDQAIALALARTGAQQVAVEQGLYRVTLAVTQYDATKLSTPDQRLNVLSSTSHIIQPGLQVQFSLHSDAMAIVTTYRRDRLSDTLISSLAHNLAHFLGEVLSTDCDPWAVPLTCPAEFEYITQDLAVTPADANSPWNAVCNVVDVVRANASQYPDVVAIEMPSSSLTYHALMSQVDCIAAALHQHGVGPQQRVAALVSNHSDTVVTLLALLTLGAVYVPIDGQLPVARQQYMIETAECTFVINAVPSLCNWPGAILFENLLFNASSYQSPVFPIHQFSADDWAYIIFTSGTTGKPKGVPIRHLGLVNVLAQDHYHLCPTVATRVLQGFAVGFDANLYICLLSFCYRGTLVLFGTDTVMGLSLASAAPMTPSMLASLDPQMYSHLHTIALGGEPTSMELIRTWSPFCALNNGYGPTETTMVTHAAHLRIGHRVTIGRPIPNVPCYILDSQRNVVPMGVIGEIYIAGPSVSPGYLNRPDLNATKFLANPFGDGVMYATGDLGRWLSNGEVECLGRMDDQVKVRGYRIELAEVANTLLAQPSVTAGAVQLYDQQLVAFVTPNDIDTTAVLNALTTQLPHYMVPSHIIPLLSIPQTVNGKLDTRALKTYFAEHRKQLSTKVLASIRTQSPKWDALQQAVGQVLGKDPATVNPGLSFIQLGGDSISAIQLSSQLKQLHYNVPIPAILERMPLRDLADTMTEYQVRTGSASLLEPAHDAPIPLTPIQAMFFGWSFRNPHHFNQSFVMELTQPIAHGQLNDALQQLVRHHAILRSQFTQTADGDWVQHLASSTDLLEQSLVDVIACDHASLHTHLVQVQRKLDLAKGQLLRGALIQLQIDAKIPPTALLFLTAHHLVVDLVSWRILLDDLYSLLQTQSLAPVPVSFGAWACALQDWGEQWTSDGIACEWTLTLPSIDLSSLDFNTEGNCRTASFSLPASLTALFTQLESYTKCFSVTPTELLLAALAQALHRLSTDPTVTIWHENHGRHPWSSDIDLSLTVGWFTAFYPVTVTADAAWSHSCFVRRIKHALRTLPHYGLVHGIQRRKQSSRSDTSTYQPLGVVFNYLGKTTDQATLTVHGQAPWTMRPDLTEGLPVCDEYERRPQLLEVRAYQEDDTVQFDLLYCPQVIPSATIAALTNELQQALHDMLTGYAHHDETLYWTPSDFPLLDLTWDDLDTIDRDLAQQNINPASVEDLYPILPTQQGLLTATAKDPSQYTVQAAFTVQGVGDHSQLHMAFQRIVAQHTILRTRFLLHWTRPSITGLQVVLCSNDIEWQVIDSWATVNTQNEDEYMRHNYVRGFTIGGPMLRCVVMPMVDNQQRLVMTMHHAITDGWSMGLLQNALLQELGHSSALACPSVKFRDYAEHMLRLESTASAQFWQAHLQAVEEATILALPKAPKPTTAMQSQAIPLLYDLTEFQRLTQQAGFTINVVLKATWALLLHRYTGQSNVVFGHTVSGRNLNVSRIDQLVGCLINTVPFCVQVERSMPLLDLLHQVSQASTAMIPHEHCHLSAIQQWTPPDLDVFNLFNTLLVYENFPTAQHTTDDGTISFTDPHEFEFTEYDLAAGIEPVHNQLVLHLSWNAHRLDQEYAIRISQYLNHLLIDVGKALTDNSTATLVDQLLALPEPEQRMLNTFTTNPSAWDESKTVVDLFTACAQRHPHVAAVELDSVVWDYHTLYSKAHRLAQWLLYYEMAAQEPVGIVVARTPAVIAMLLGVGMAGGAFVLIDPEYPLDRINFIASDCGIKHLCYTIPHAELAQRVSTTMAVAAHGIDTMLATAPETASPNVGQALPSNLAYILYTSGSTGQPKGAMIEHRGLSNLVQHTPSILPHTRSHFRHMQALAMTFDACIWDMYMALCHGGTLVLRVDIAHTLHSVDSAILTPSLMAVLDPAQYPNLKTVVVGGERLPSDVALKWAQRCHIFNVYGPTEITIITTVCHYQPSTLITIGRPIHNSEVHILDPHRQPVPIGAVGELYIGGPGVMRGYANRPDLDAKALITHPLTPDKRLFKTGDLGRWLANGEIECLGRQDDQVKIRGMRLELQEIEAVLRRDPMLTMAAVLVFDHMLYAFVCPAQVEEHVVKSYLSSQLPAYMVPAHIVSLDVIPLTISGKADKSALLALISKLKQQPAPCSGEPPQTPTQAIICEAMAKALSVDSDTIGIHDSFFTLGGDSLSAIRFTGLCREKGLSITVGQVFDKATVAGLAQVCHKENTASIFSVSPLSAAQPLSPFALLDFTQDAIDRIREGVAQQLGIAPAAITDMVPVSSLQSGFIVNTLKDPSAYMVQQSYRITGALDVERYHECWRQVGQRHSILRTKFATTDLVSRHAAFQVVLATMDMAWSYDDSHDPSDADFERSYFAADRQHGFAFDGSPLIRMALFKITDTDYWLFLTFHHALLDAWSTNIVLDEVLTLYHKQPLYPALEYRTYLAHLMRKPVQATQAFWQATLRNAKPTPDLRLPSMLPPSPSAPSYKCHEKRLSCPLTDIHAFSQQIGITTNNLLRGLWALLLSRYLNEQHEVTFGVLVSGRNESLPGIDDMVGLTINTVPFRATFGRDQTLHDWLQGIHRLSGKIMAHGHASLVNVQKWAGVPADTPLFQSLLVYDKFRESALSLDNPQIQCIANDGVNYTEYPLNISFTDVDNELHIVLMYAASKYDPAYITLISDYLDACLTWIVESTPDTLVASLWQLPPSERFAITTWSQGEEKTLDPSCHLLPDLFVNSLWRTPDAIALDNGDERWTYAQVHQQALIIAHWLLEHQVQPGDCVALVFKRSPSFVFALLAVLLVGGVYTPIEATAATEHIYNSLEELGKPVTLIESIDEPLAQALLSVTSQIGYCDAIFNQNSSTLSLALPPPRQPHDLAYIIFTLSMTDQPRGVQVRHESVVNTLVHIAQTMNLDSHCRFLQLLNIAFDGCLIEIFTTFYCGGTLVLARGHFEDDLHRVNSCLLTPSLLTTLNPDDYPDLQKVFSGGEALSWPVACQWAKGRQLFNGYGPTEIAIASHVETVQNDEAVTLGRPMPNTQCYVLDAQRRPVPMGVLGEICIAGLGISNGYINRPDLTAKAFVPNPFGAGQMYLTGDLGCWLPNGKIKYQGRRDLQVQLRGFRIELHSVADALARYDGVQQACALVQDNRLIGYVSPIDVDVWAIIAFVKAHLPHYMVPAAIVPLDTLPLTPVGNIDRRALPKHVFAPQCTDASTIPRTPMENCLIQLLAQVLHISHEVISPQNTFFEVGGDSLRAIRLVTLCRRQGLTLAMVDITRNHTIAQLAMLMEAKQAPLSATDLYPAVNGPVPLRTAQPEFSA